MSPQVRPAVAFALLALLVLPTALAQLPISPTPPEGPPKPNFVPGNGHVVAIDERFPTRVCVEVANVHGDETTTHGSFDVLIRVDGSYADAFRVTERLRSGDTASGCTTVDLRAGNHTYDWIVDANEEVAESDETDNGLDAPRRFVVAPAPMPDLRLSVLEVLPRVGRPGERQDVHAFVENVGDGPSPASNLTLADGAGFDARLRVPPLAPGSGAHLIAWIVVDEHASGSFLLDGRVDPEDALLERREDNNAASTTFEVPEHPAPDLVVLDVNVTGRLVANESLRLNVTIANVGDARAGALAVHVLDGETVVAELSRDALGAGQNATFSRLVRLPEGDRALRVVVDPARKVVERDETNNVREISLSVAPRPVSRDAPNLVVESVDGAPSDPGPGEAVRVVAVVRNGGALRAPASTVALLVDGAPHANGTVAALDPGRSATVSFTWRAPSIGAYTLRARADPADLVDESDEADNEGAAVFHVTEPAPPPPPPTPTPTQPIATPTPVATPTATPTAPPPTPGDGGEEGVVVRAMDVVTRPVPGGLKGVIVASLQNPSLEAAPRLTVTFRVDGAPIKEILLDGIAPAGTQPVSSGEIDLPPGSHVVAVEAKAVGAPSAASSLTKPYTAEAGQSGVPGPGVALAVAAVAAVAVLRRRRS